MGLQGAFWMFVAAQYIEGKGAGLVAIRNLPQGARIIAEHPFHRFPTDMSLADIWSFLTNPQTKNEESFKLHENKGDVADQTPEQGALSNVFPAMDEFGDPFWASFPTIGLINHACVPNAEYWWDHGLQDGKIRLIRNINAGEEITINYRFGRGFDTGKNIIGDIVAGREIHYGCGACRCHSAHIRGKFGFTCLCNACKQETSHP